MSGVTLYSANIGDYDQPRQDVFTFTEDKLNNPRLSSRMYKMLPHKFFDTEWTIWMDGTFWAPHWEELWHEVMASGREIAVFAHPERDCVYEEAKEVIRLKLDHPNIVNEQMARYQSAGYPRKNGMAACGFIIRKNTPEVNRLNEAWWAEYCTGSRRDQLSFPFIFRDYYSFQDKDFYSYKRKPHLKPRTV